MVKRKNSEQPSLFQDGPEMDAPTSAEPSCNHAYYRRRAAGVCVVCADRPAVAGGIRCEPCRIARVERQRERNRKNRVAGLCVCGKAARPGKKTCQACAAKNRRDNVKTKAKRLARVAALPPGEHIGGGIKVGRGAYASGCRCQGCLDAVLEYNRAYRNRTDINKKRRDRLANDHAWRQHQREVVKKSARKRRADPEKHAKTLAGNRERIRKKRERVNAIKLQSGCVDCGYRAHHVALDFDHVRGKKRFNISLACQHRSWAAIEAEIARCVVRCACCHRIRTWERRQAKKAQAGREKPLPE